MKFRLSIAAAVLSLALAACGGGGSAGSVAAPAQPVVPAAGATPVPMSTPTTAPQSTAQITLTMPSKQSSARGRSPQYVSPNAGLFQSTVVSVNGSTTLPNGTPAVLTTPLSSAAGGNCKMDFSGPPPGKCVVTIQAPTGTVVYQFDLFDKAGGSRLATGNSTFTMPATGLTAQLSGIAAFVTLFTPANMTYGVSMNEGFGIDVRDATTAIIFGPAPFSQPFTLCDSDTSGHTSLHGGIPGTPDTGPVQCLVVAGTSTVMALNYDGAQIPPITITASGGSLPAGGFSRTIYAEPRIVLTGMVALPFNQSQLTFSGSPQTKSFTATQPGHTGPFGFTHQCGSGTDAIVSVATTDHITFDVTALKSGTCAATIGGLQTSVEFIHFFVP
ncbi:MAG TPA: hypothetical protein VN224_01985 [Xanthomonadales bacterium]|nr:hypothetical protein [Xanthomonadales bacterium]